MTTLDLDREILISGLRGEHPIEARDTLEAILTTVRARVAYLAERQVRSWDGAPTVLVIAPSSVVLKDFRVSQLTEAVVRFARLTGLAVRLVDVLAPLHRDRSGQDIYPLTAFGGSATVRQYANDPLMTAVTYHPVSATEITDMVEHLIAPTTAPTEGRVIAGELAAYRVDRDEARRKRVESILLASGEPLRVAQIMDRLGPAAAGVFPRDADDRRQAVLDVLAALVDADWVERWIEADGHTYQVREAYEPRDDGNDHGVREAIRLIMLRRDADPVHRDEIITAVNRHLSGESYVPESDRIVTGHLADLVAERFLGEPMTGYYTVTVAARRYHTTNYTTPVRRRVADIQQLTRTRVAETILTALTAATAPFSTDDLTRRVNEILEEQETSVADSTIRRVLLTLVDNGAVEKPANGMYQLAAGARGELACEAGLARRWDRLTALRAEILQKVKMNPGWTKDRHDLDGAFNGGLQEIHAALDDLVATGEVVVSDDDRYYDPADAVGLRTTTEENR